MNTDKLVKALRCTKNENSNCVNCKFAVFMKNKMLDYCEFDILETAAADLITAQQAELNRLQQENKQLKELLRLAVGDMASIADIIANSHELLADGEDEVRNLHLGRCDVCNKNCTNDDDDSDDGCIFKWQHADRYEELKKQMEG